MSATITANVALTVSGRRLELQMAVPTGPTRPVELLPLFHRITDAFVSAAVEAVTEEGKAISCRAGCGACCRQLVPIAPSEARRLKSLIDELPEPRQVAVRQRFADALGRLGQAGLLDKLRNLATMPKEEHRALGLAYFTAGVPCPFLEDESCSVHPERPSACREYLVTSPAEYCSRPTAETIDCVAVPAKVSNAVARLENPSQVVPLVLAPEWAVAHPDEPERPGTELVQAVFGYFQSPGSSTSRTSCRRS
jgi:Fe-S-cluster containining protein